MTGKILVVDDVPQNVKLLEAKLSGEYYTVFSSYSGREALEMAGNVAPDIILLDIMMPEMDGFEVCRHLKDNPLTTHIPVIMVTALSEAEDRVQGLSAGADDFITKPIDELHLFARVKSLIRLKMMLDELRMRDKTGSELGIGNGSAGDEGEKTGGIAVIDDDFVQSRNIKNILQAKGHTIFQYDPHDATTDNLDASKLDLIIINTLLDDVDGLRLAVQIRSHENFRHIPIMLLVDEDDKPLLIKGLEIGIDDYLITPMDENELIARTCTQIRRKSYQDALRNSYQESISAAVVDSLTKLYNRRYLDAHLQNIVAEALEHQGDLSLMTIDIDHFKSVNDRPGWGHHIGDEILQQVAERIMNSVRSTDLATRPGGEEFVVVMPNTNKNIALGIAERTRRNIADRPFSISADPGRHQCTVSIGVSTLSTGGDSSQELLKRSDAALYEAKESGRNRVMFGE